MADPGNTPPRNKADRDTAIRALTACANTPRLNLTERDSEGHYIVYYCVDMPPPNAQQDPRYYADNIARLTPTEVKGLEEALRAIEGPSNLRFRPMHYDGSRLPDIAYFSGKPTDRKMQGASRMVLFSNTRDIVIDAGLDKRCFDHGSNGYFYFLHETLHAVGLSHPFGSNGGRDGGENPEFDKDATVLSYNKGKLNCYGLGPFDVATLHYLYGTPGGSGVHVADGAKLAVTDTIFAPSGVAQLDFSHSTMPGQLTIDMGSAEFHAQVGGVMTVAPDDNRWIGTRLALGTQLNHVMTDDKTAARFVVKGNAAANVMQGGKEQDRFTAVGGNDVMTGRDGRDIFVFDGQSGHNNIVTDFTKDDFLFVGKDVVKVEVMPYAASSGNPQGLKVTMHDAAGAAVASVFLPNADLAELPKQVRLDADMSQQPQIVAPTTPGKTTKVAQQQP